ncbi:hypothetical protein PILCRDRAFT_86655 [Piloderma croceum F 1598]|uniref:Uncharacterized protein n=1 Tax=Piloderma croceum (strain F 1598) TaxID=765440 RepID=A0A0C3FPC8_PILCF|nr:hypothetical protein PILCRDRAFT_86655 [Piloderma croceum F 1598]
MTWTVNVDRSLVILPLFFTYVFGSFASLRVWLAVQKIPPVTKAEVNEEIPPGDHDTKRWLVRLMSYPTVLFALGYIVSGDSSSRYTLIFWGLIVVSLVFVTAVCLMDVFGLRRSVHRNPGGTLYIRLRFLDHPGAWRRLGFGVMVLTCMVLPVVTLWYNSDVGASIMVFALLYAFQAINNPRTMSMRQIIIAAIVIEAHKILLLYFASLLAIIFSTVKTDRASIQQLYEHFTAYCGNFANWFYVPCMGLPLSFITSMSLRLDFANHIARVQLYQDHSADLMMLEEVSAPEEKSPMKQLTAGIVIPSSIPVAFDCPYFLSTLLTWIFTNTAIMQLLAHGWLPDFGRFVYALYVLLCALPMAVLSVVGVSLVRGEARHMWTYKEHWNLEPVEEKPVRISEKVRELIDLKEEHV